MKTINEIIIWASNKDFSESTNLKIQGFLFAKGITDINFYSTGRFKEYSFLDFYHWFSSTSSSSLFPANYIKQECLNLLKQNYALKIDNYVETELFCMKYLGISNSCIRNLAALSYREPLKDYAALNPKMAYLYYNNATNTLETTESTNRTVLTIRDAIALLATKI